MTCAQNNQKWKRLLSLVLCIVMCMAPVISAANVRAVAPETMDATSVALPKENVNDTSTQVQMLEEEENSAPKYWWGTASQATAKIGDAITGISDRHSVIFDSPIEEGYENSKTSSYFQINTSWAAFDMGTQDLMFYLELPEAATSIRMKHICADSWGKWPRPSGMKYQYLAADGTSWQEGVIDQNNELKLTSGFKGYVRLLLNTAENCESYADSTIELQFFAFRIGAFGGSYGAAKLGGVWFVSKGEAYKVSVDGGSEAKLTTADAKPAEKPADWTGDVLTATVPNEETAAVGETSAWITWSDKKWGAVPEVTLTAAESITKIGAQKSVTIDSPKLEGYKSGGEKNSFPIFKIGMNSSELNIAEQDVMFYLELPAGTSSIRLDGISFDSGTMTPAGGNLPYQYLSMDSETWVDGVTDSNKQIDLADGFKGYIRLRISEANGWWWQNHDSTDDSWKTTTRPMDNFTFHCARFGGEAGALKFGGMWFVSKEATRYIKVNGGDTVCMTTPVEQSWITATSVYKETAAVGETSAVATWTDQKWGVAPSDTCTVGEGINPLKDGQKTLLIDSAKHEGYHLDDSSERSHAKYDISIANESFDMAKQALMLYIEMPETAQSLRLVNIFFKNDGTLSPYTSGCTYDYLAADAETWVTGKKCDGNSQIDLPAGFKGYIRIDVTTTTGWWWENHGSSGENSAWKTQTATLTDVVLKFAKYGGDLGAVKIGGIWIASKENLTDAAVNGADAVAMTTYAPAEPVMQATSVAVESDPTSTWDARVSYTDDASWKTIDSQTKITLGDAITKISDRKSVVIDSEIPEGYKNDGTTTWPLFRVTTDAVINADKQDLMLYVELPETMSSLRIQDVTCQGFSFWLAPAGVKYQYLAMDSNDWVDGTISTEGNKQLDLPQGFKGYVRLLLNTAGNYESLGENGASLKIDALHFRAERFGGELGALKIGGVWFTSKTDTYMVSVDGGEAVKMTDAPDPEPSEPSEPTEPSEPEERDYLIGTMPNEESAEVGATSSLISIDKNTQHWNIESQATATAADGITIIGDQKSVTLDSPIEEGYGNSRTSTLYTVSCGWKTLDLKTQDVMFYVELPATSSTMRIWDFTCDNWSFWVNTRGTQYQYLAIDGSEWVDGGQITQDDNKQIVLPQGFKGYVRLKVDTAKNTADKETLQIQSFSFYAETFGGDVGTLKFGGVWFVSKEDYIKIKVDDGEVLKMTTAVEPEPTEPSEPSEPTEPDPSKPTEPTEPTEPSEPEERDYLIGTMPNEETAESGKESTMISMNDSEKFWDKASQATMVAGDPITIIGNQKSVIIDSPIEEGYGNKQTSPLYTVSCGWKDLDTTTQDIMFYVELPDACSSLRIWDFTCNNWGFWVAPAGMKYQYLAMDSNAWKDGTISTDGNKQINLPGGFKGYVRMQLNTAGNAASFPGTTLKIQSFSFRGDVYGGDNGAIKFGGVWFVSKEEYIKIKVDDGEVLKMTNATEPIDPPDPVDPVNPDDPNRDYIIGTMPNQESAMTDKKSTLVSISDDTKWWGTATQSTAVAGDPITIIGDQKSVIIDSPILEGYENKSTSALYSVSCGWKTLDLKTQDVMFYIEMPVSGRGSSSIRLWDISCDNYSFWVNTRGMKYQYLSMNSKQWVDGQIGTDDNKQIDLPDGFKGYVRLKVDTAANTSGKDSLLIQAFSFRPGTFGAEYGAVKLGGVWFVTRENFCYIRVDGAAKKVMTTYWQYNDALLEEFRELIEELTDKDLSAAPTVDRLQTLYEAMSDEYRDKITKEELDKLNEYAAAVEAYRPEFLGVTLKKYGTKPQSAKVGWTVDEALAKKSGYKVVASGAVMLYGRSYDGKSIIDETTPAVTKMTGTSATGYYYATTTVEANNYKQAMLLRCYVVYEDTKTGEQYTVWCGMYTDKSGQTTPYMKCSLYEVAVYFGVPLYAN